MINTASNESGTWFEQLYSRHSKALWYYLLKTVGNSTLAEDLFQETFYRMWRVKPKGLHPAQERAYLFKIATHLAIDFYRKEKNSRSFLLLKDPGDERDDPVVETGFDKNLEPFLNKLSVRDRSLLWLAYVEEYSHKDIANIMGTKADIIKVQLFRAKQKLISLLKGSRRNG